MSGELVVMVGLPRSGKTTVVREQYLPQGYAVVCPDDVRMVMYGRKFIAQAEPLVWAVVTYMVDALMLSGCKVVVDGCFGTEKRRKPFRERGAKFHVVDTHKDECIRRARLVNYEELVPVIERMAEEYQSPDLPSCADCGALMEPVGSAFKCSNCGATSGSS